MMKLDGSSHYIDYVLRPLLLGRKSAFLQRQAREVSLIPSGKIPSCLDFLIPLLTACFLLISPCFSSLFLSSPYSNTTLSKRYS